MDHREGAEGAGGEAGGGGFHRDRADEGAGDRLRRDTARVVALPVPLTVPAPEALPKATAVVLSEVTVLPAASWIVAVEQPRRARGEIGARAGESDQRGGAVNDGERAEGAGGEPTRRRLHRDRADQIACDRLRLNTVEAVAVPVPVTVPLPDAFAKATTVVLSFVTVWPAASWIVAVSTRVTPEPRSVVEAVSAIWVAAAAATTSKLPSVPVVRPPEMPPSSPSRPAAR